MSNSSSKEERAIDDLVSRLPEVYQPIYQHSEYSSEVSRGCEDRLVHISGLHSELHSKLSRPVRVLDLGCAQGYFSLGLGALGAEVTGVDYSKENISLCHALAAENPKLEVNFKLEDIEETLRQMKFGQYDLVLGLSVFHHLVHEHDYSWVENLIANLARKVQVGIFEIALKTEPLYWGSAQPIEPGRLLDGFAFVHRIAEHKTHLSSILRPMFVASNYCWYLNGRSGFFDRWQTESHTLAEGTHQQTRRYYFGDGLVAKVYYLDNEQRSSINYIEYNNEVNYLNRCANGIEKHESLLKAPKLVLQGKTKNEAWLVREYLPGDLLVDIIRSKKQYNGNSIVWDVLKQLVALEKIGLYHNDVRIWNVLVDEQGKAQLIDYGAISSIPSDCVWPSNIFLSFFIFMRELYEEYLEVSDPIRVPIISLDRLPEHYKSAILRFLRLPLKEWNYAALSSLISEDSFSNNTETESTISDGHLLLLNTMEEAVDLYRIRQGQQNEQVQLFEAKTRQAEERALQFEAQSRQAEERALQFEAQSRQAEERALQFEAQSRQAEERALQSETQTRQVSEQITNATNMLDAVYNSRSWRVTAPMRWVGHQKSLLREHGMVSRTEALMKKIVRPFGRRRIALISSRPGLHSNFVTLAKKLGIYESLRSKYLHNTLAHQVAEPHVAEEDLTPHARQIHVDLQTAILRHQEESN